MSKCKGCGAVLQTSDLKGIGYSPKEDAEYCQRCFRLRHYGDVTIDMKQGIESNKTLDLINDLDGTVFWVVDLFNFESNMISRLNQKLPGKKIVLVLTKLDLLPETLSASKIDQFVRHRLAEEGIQISDIVLTGGMLRHGQEAEQSIGNLWAVIHRNANESPVIFMGMANAGKSTLLNQLTGSSDLTVSRHPGTTLGVVETKLEDGRICYDTPGIENTHSYLTYMDDKMLRQVIPTKPIMPQVTQIFEDQSFAIGGLARIDVICDGKATAVGYFSRDLHQHRGKLTNADDLWSRQLGELLTPTLDTDWHDMDVYHAKGLKKGEKLDVVIHGLGWMTLSGDVKAVIVRVHKGIYVTFRKAMI